MRATRREMPDREQIGARRDRKAPRHHAPYARAASAYHASHVACYVFTAAKGEENSATPRVGSRAPVFRGEEEGLLPPAGFSSRAAATPHAARGSCGG